VGYDLVRKKQGWETNGRVKAPGEVENIGVGKAMRGGEIQLLPKIIYS